MTPNDHLASRLIPVIAHPKQGLIVSATIECVDDLDCVGNVIGNHGGMLKRNNP